MFKFALIIALSFGTLLSGYAAEHVLADVSTTEETEKQKQDEEDALFTGIKIKNGDTTIIQGEQIAADPSIFHTGKWTPEQLAQFNKHVVSSNVPGSISYSESSTTTSLSSSSLYNYHTEENTQNTGLYPGMTVTTIDRDSN